MTFDDKNSDPIITLPDPPELTENRAAGIRQWLLEEARQDAPVPATAGSSIRTVRPAPSRLSFASPLGRTLVGAAAVTALAFGGLTVANMGDRPTGITLAAGDGPAGQSFVPVSDIPASFYDQCGKVVSTTTSLEAMADANMLYGIDNPSPLDDFAVHVRSETADCVPVSSTVEGIYLRKNAKGATDSALTVWGPDAGAPWFSTMNSEISEVPLGDGVATLVHDDIQALSVLGWTFGDNSWVITASNVSTDDILAAGEQVQRDQNASNVASELPEMTEVQAPKKVTQPPELLVLESVYYVAAEREPLMEGKRVRGQTAPSDVYLSVVRDAYPGTQANLSISALRPYDGPGKEPNSSWYIPEHKVTVINGIEVTSDVMVVAGAGSSDQDSSAMYQGMQTATWEPEPGVIVSLNTNNSSMDEARFFDLVASVVKLSPDDPRFIGNLVE